MSHNLPAAHRSDQLQGRTLLLARLAWAVIALAVIATLVVAFPYRIDDLQQDPYGLGPPLAQWGLNIGAFVIYGLVEFLVIVASLVMAAVIFWRKSSEWIGLLISMCWILMVAALPAIPALGLAIPSYLPPFFCCAYRHLSALSWFVSCFPMVVSVPDGRCIDLSSCQCQYIPGSSQT
jgi:hypothetical protein